MVKNQRPGLSPLNGVDRCWCGCKYWTADARCNDCGELHEPSLPFDNDQEREQWQWPR